MYGWCERDEPKNGSKAVTLLLRLSTLALALASAVTMATVDAACTSNGTAAAAAAVTYKDYRAFVYLVGSNVAAAVLQAAAIYLQLSGGGDDDDEKSSVPGVLLVVADVLAQALLYSSTGAAYSTEIGVGCVVFGEQVGRSKLLSLGASVSVGLAAVVKDVPLPFSVWPSSSD